MKAKQVKATTIDITFKFVERLKGGICFCGKEVRDGYGIRINDKPYCDYGCYSNDPTRGKPIEVTP